MSPALEKKRPFLIICTPLSERSQLHPHSESQSQTHISIFTHNSCQNGTTVSGHTLTNLSHFFRIDPDHTPSQLKNELSFAV